MCDPQKLLTIAEAAEILHLNPEVVRRWLRSKKLYGIKVGSDWRLPESSLQKIFQQAANSGTSLSEEGPKMCIKFPKWIEFSGLPAYLNSTISPLAWPIFKKLVELDFEEGEREDFRVPFDFRKTCQRVGYSEEDTKVVLKELSKLGVITLDTKHDPPTWFEIQRPLKTPQSIFDIVFANGGIKGAPEKAFENKCLRRYLV